MKLIKDGKVTWNENEANNVFDDCLFPREWNLSFAIRIVEHCLVGEGEIFTHGDWRSSQECWKEVHISKKLQKRWHCEWLLNLISNIVNVTFTICYLKEEFQHRYLVCS